MDLHNGLQVVTTYPLPCIWISEGVLPTGSKGEVKYFGERPPSPPALARSGFELGAVTGDRIPGTGRVCMVHFEVFYNGANRRIMLEISESNLALAPVPQDESNLRKVIYTKPANKRTKDPGEIARGTRG